MRRQIPKLQNVAMCICLIYIFCDFKTSSLLMINLTFIDFVCFDMG